MLFLHLLQVFRVSSIQRLPLLLMSVCLPARGHCVLLTLGIFSGWGNPSHFLKSGSKSCHTVHTYGPVFFTSRLLKRVIFSAFIFTSHLLPNPLLSAFRHRQCTTEVTLAWVITYLVTAQVRGFLSVLCEHLAPPPTFLTFLLWHLPRFWLIFALPHLGSCPRQVCIFISSPPVPMW